MVAERSGVTLTDALVVTALIGIFTAIRSQAFAWAQGMLLKKRSAGLLGFSLNPERWTVPGRIAGFGDNAVSRFNAVPCGCDVSWMEGRAVFLKYPSRVLGPKTGVG